MYRCPCADASRSGASPRRALRPIQRYGEAFYRNSNGNVRHKELTREVHHLQKYTDHRPFPLPTGAWIMTQTWERLLFAHWPVPPEIVKAHLPKDLPLDTYDGYAWIGIVPFHMSGIRLRWLPAIPSLSAFPEIYIQLMAESCTVVIFIICPGHFNERRGNLKQMKCIRISTTIYQLQPHRFCIMPIL